MFTFVLILGYAMGAYGAETALILIVLHWLMND
jgi:hypothetical protein